MKTLSFEVIKEAWIKVGYPIEEMIREKKVIISGIRMNNQLDNTFNDFLTVCHWNESLQKYEFFGGMGTTDPGNYYIKNPMNVKGTFVMRKGFYRNVWVIGKHYGYDALVQVGTFVGWRTLDGTFPVIKGMKAYGSDSKELQLTSAINCGINMHSTKKGFKFWLVDRWSAACQVWHNWELFLKFMKVCHEQRSRKMMYFSYALFDEDDFN